jgi:hypothetical protein
MNFDRYSSFKNDGSIEIVPYIEIRKKSTDKHIKYDKKSMRLDKLSYQYYSDTDYAWLIMQANPEHGSIESFIPDGVILRIPYPLNETLNNYVNDIITYKELYK